MIWDLVDLLAAGDLTNRAYRPFLPQAGEDVWTHDPTQVSHRKILG